MFYLAQNRSFWRRSSQRILA